MQVTKHSIEIDPRVIKHLGSDLITSSDVAITELVKNSVDARSRSSFRKHIKASKEER